VVVFYVGEKMREYVEDGMVIAVLWATQYLRKGCKSSLIATRSIEVIIGRCGVYLISIVFLILRSIDWYLNS
jgi:hypothetical protein